MKQASEDIRELAVHMYATGKYTQQQVAEIVGYHVNSVKKRLRIAKAGLPQKPGRKGCRPRALTAEDIDRLKDLLEEDRCHNLDELTLALGKSLRSVVHRMIHELGYTYKKTVFASQRLKDEIIR